jgi:transcriptional regulator GlxA family with amidase domain
VVEAARAVGISVRSLQAAFSKHRGSSPMAFLRDRRLESARQRSLTMHSPSVTEVALACGFSHLGRFSQLYRERFGESPTETRRRAFR